MTFRTTLGVHLTMAASGNMIYIASDYKNKVNMKVAASNINIKIHHFFSKSGFFVSAGPLYSGKSQGT